MRTMRTLLFVCALPFTLGGPPCCKTKENDGSVYTLYPKPRMGHFDLTQYNCKDMCIYEKIEEPGSKYCFQDGGYYESICNVPTSDCKPVGPCGSDGICNSDEYCCKENWICVPDGCECPLDNSSGQGPPNPGPKPTKPGVKPTKPDAGPTNPGVEPTKPAVEPSTGVTKVDAIKALKATVQNIADGLVGLENGRKKREASDDEKKLLEILNEISTYLQNECGSANGNCDVKKIEAAKEQLKSTYDNIKATGTVSPGFTQSFEEQKNSFETAAAAAEAAQAMGEEGAGGDCAYAAVDPQHTMCTGEPPQEVGEEDGLKLWKGKCDIKMRVLDQVGADSILKQMNMRRNEVAGGIGMDDNKQPTASNMKKLVWNDEVATIAQRWADQCSMHHDTGHRATLDGVNTGQNAFIASFARQIQTEYGDYGDYYDYKRVRREANDNQNKTRVKRRVWWDNLNIDYVNTDTLGEIQQGIGKMTDAWFDEYKKLTDPSIIEEYVFQEATGHYTQDVWAETEEIGCGFNFFSTGVREGGTWEDYTLLLFCNFKPAGNMIGAEIYKIGPAASECPAGYSADAEYPNLCSK